MQVINHIKYIELKPENKYLTDLEETFIAEGLCGKDLDINSYKDISDEEAEKILEKINEEIEEDGKKEEN